MTLMTRSFFRSQTLTQSYKMNHSDEFVAIKGSQNMSFNYVNAPGRIQQSIERSFQLSDYWIWAVPNLSPEVSFSLVVQTGNESLAWFRNGTNSMVTDPGTDLGFADAGLTQYLVSDLDKFDPLLLYHMIQGGQVECADLEINGISLPAVYDPITNLTIGMDPTTYLPHVVRISEYNQVFGASTNDLYLANYQPPNSSNTSTSMMLPRRFETVYNGGATIQDVLFENVEINPVFDAGQFDVQPDPNSKHPVQNRTANYLETDLSKVGEFYETALWSGEFIENLDQVNATHPIPDLPQLWHLTFSTQDGDQGGYAQLVIEVEDGVLVADAPDHLVQIVLGWINDNLHKPVKYIWPTHHHHDHAYGLSEYIGAGAKAVIPEIARHYWSNIPGASVITFNETQPFAVSDANLQVRALWQPEAPHAEDLSWLVVTKTCPSEADQMIIFEADVWNPDDQEVRSDMGFTRQWLQWLDADGIRNNTIVTACHGGTRVLQELIDITGYAYPEHQLNDFEAGGSLCTNGTSY